MSKLIDLDTYDSKTYATRQDAINAFEKKFGNMDIRYIVMQNEEGRYFPVGIGEKAVQSMVHFHFHVLC